MPFPEPDSEFGNTSSPRVSDKGLYLNLLVVIKKSQMTQCSESKSLKETGKAPT